MTIEPPSTPASGAPSGRRAERDTDIAIVGGGMMGMTLALMFAKALPHLQVTLIEAHSLEPNAAERASFDERSTAVSPTTQRALIELGLWGPLQPFTSDITHIHISDSGQLGVAGLGPQDNRDGPLGHVIKNAGFGGVLLEAIRERKVRVLAPCTVTATASIIGGVRISLSNAEPLTARLLIVADGAASPVRGQLGIGASVQDYRQHAVVANVAFAKAHNSCAYERFTGNGPIALLPLGAASSNRASLVWTWPNQELDRVKAMSESALLTELQTQFGYRLGAFSRIGARAYYPLSLCIAKEQVRSNLVLMGNAAHFLHPVAGQGFNLAVRDGLRLVAVVKNAGAEKLGNLNVLTAYVSGQQQDQWRTILLSHGFNQIFRRSDALIPKIRSVGFLLMNAVEPVKNQMIMQLSGKASPRAQPWQ